MPPSKPDPLDRTTGFGPNRHRMEIELMEKRFRERSERRAGSPPSTGEIEGKVSDEMRQFFDASTQQLESVVPRLQEGQNGQGMVETTGEIKKKIDEFFSEDAPVASATAPPQPVRSSPPAPAPARSPAPPPRAAASAPPPRAPAPAPVAASAAPPAQPPGASEAEPPMDLKSALEKLRRHGVAKGNDANGRAGASRPAAPSMRAAVPAPQAGRRDPPLPALGASPAQPQRGSAPMGTDERVQAPPPRGSADAPPPSQRPTSNPRPISNPRPDAQARQSAQPSERGTLLPPRPKPKAPGEKTRQIAELPAISTDEVSLTALPAPTIRRAPRPGEPAPATTPVEADAKFDAIFDEVQGIVLDTLKASVNETFDAARAAEPELSQVAVPTLGEPVAAAVPETVPMSVAPPSARKTRLPVPEEDEEESKDDELPAGPHDWGVKRSAKPKGAWLLDAEEAPAKPEPSPQTVTGDLPSLARAEEQPSTGGGGGGGARSYLLRKAGDEVKRFQPVLKALQQKKLVDVEKPAAQAAGGEDEFVSAASFKDSRPSPEELEQELSPMRLVEELRRLKRVTQALIAKGVISTEDLAKAADD